MNSIKRRFLVNQLATIIHHAYIRFYCLKDQEAVMLFEEWLETENIAECGVNPTQIKQKAELQVKSNAFERILAEMGRDTSGSYAVLPKVAQLRDDILQN